jgi:hypothetical protein
MGQTIFTSLFIIAILAWGIMMIKLAIDTKNSIKNMHE